MNKGKCILSIGFLLSVFTARGQDVHFSQFYETATLRNPALTGIFSDEYKLSFTYRNQWASISKPFRTGQVSGETRISLGNEVNDYLSIGLLGYSDKAGRANFKTDGYYAALNYNKSLEDNRSTYLSVGFTAGWVSRSIDVSKMTFDNQYLNPGGGGEQLPDARLSHYDLGAGVSLNSSLGKDNRTSYFLGLSAYHFTLPRQSFFQKEAVVNLQIRWNLNAGLNLALDDAWGLILHGNYMRQGSYNEIIAGGLLRWSRFNNLNQRNLALSLGAFYRLNDAAIPVLKLDYKTQSFSISYDINVSSIKAASNMRGGLEFSVLKTGFFGGGVNDKHMCPRF